MKSLKEIKRIAKTLIGLSLQDNGKIDEVNTNKILHLIKNNKLEDLGIKVEDIQVITLLKEYQKILKNLVIEDTITITTAINLDLSEKQKTEETIKKRFYKSNIKYSIDKDLIAGIKIQSGWDSIDETIQNKLNTLKF